MSTYNYFPFLANLGLEIVKIVNFGVVQLLGVLFCIGSATFRGNIYATPFWSKTRFESTASKGLVEVENEVKWR
jgi:uncharacterized membrane protein YgdD (TMEM256/DUF423 family)